MEGKSEYVQEVFTEIADDYDMMNNKMTWGMLKGWQKIVMQKTRLKAGDKGLDVCCGTGEMTFQQREIVGPIGEVVGLDFTQSMLDVANRKLEKYHYKNVSFVQGDAMDLPFADNTFQAATNGFALRNVVDIPKTISEMARVVAPKGRVVCIDVSVPQFFLFRWFFNIYYYKLVPIMGHQVDNNKKIASKFPAYTWLAESLKTLPPQDAIKQMFIDAGLEEVGYKGVGFGAATIYWGTKPADEDQPEPEKKDIIVEESAAAAVAVNVVDKLSAAEATVEEIARDILGEVKEVVMEQIDSRKEDGESEVTTGDEIEFEEID